MYLLNNEIALGLNIVGWQFPNATDEYDAEWTQVQLDVRHPSGSWSVSAPALTFCGAEQLVEHLHREGDWDLRFTEPCLEFQRRDGMIFVVLAHEFAPTWARDGIRLSFPARQAYGAAEALRHDLEMLQAR